MNRSSTALRTSPSWPAAWRRHLPGLAACLVLAIIAIRLGRLPWLASHGFSALTVAIVLGIAAGNALPQDWTARAGPGIVFAKQVLLRAGIVLYGAKLTLQDIGRVGAAGGLSG